MDINPSGRNKRSDVVDVTEHSHLHIDHIKISYLGWLFVVIGFGGFVLWATLAPLDEGVSISGQVVVTGNRKVVQNLSPGMVETILVKDGDVVKSGDALVRLDATMANAQYEVAHSQWQVAKATEARFIASSIQKKEISFPPELLDEASDPRVKNAMAVQSQLLHARASALEADLNVFRSTIAGLEATMAGIDATLKSKEEQSMLLREELKGLRQLAGDGYFPRNRLSEQERLLAQLNGAISEDEANLRRSRQNIVEIRMRGLARQQEYRKENEIGLSDVQKDVTSLESRLKGLEFELKNMVVRAPSEGIVVGLNVHTVGGVVPAGSTLMELVPRKEELKVDVQIPSTLIDKVKVGLPVQIMFPAFNQRTTPQIPGWFVQVAADAISDPQGKVPPFYKGQVVVAIEGLDKLKSHEIKAGMPSEVFIKTGERTMLNYLLKPLNDRLRASLTEQ